MSKKELQKQIDELKEQRSTDAINFNKSLDVLNKKLDKLDALADKLGYKFEEEDYIKKRSEMDCFGTHYILQEKQIAQRWVVKKK